MRERIEFDFNAGGLRGSSHRERRASVEPPNDLAKILATSLGGGMPCDHFQPSCAPQPPPRVAATNDKRAKPPSHQKIDMNFMNTEKRLDAGLSR